MSDFKSKMHQIQFRLGGEGEEGDGMGGKEKEGRVGGKGKKEKGGEGKGERMWRGPESGLPRGPCWLSAGLVASFMWTVTIGYRLSPLKTNKVNKNDF